MSAGDSFEFQPVIIIGAGRSGTNMLRDLLCKVDGIATWPCDEINYIWRHGNVTAPDDELGADDATPAIKHYIRRQFQKMADKANARYLVEKTCANTLRVDFVDQIIPEARYIFIVRHGIDAVASAMHRWNADLDIAYIARKARYVPTLDLPYYASKYFFNRLARLKSGKQRLAYWGPKFDGFEDYLPGRSLEQICARQWQVCVETASKSLGQIDPARVYTLRYEDFVSEPQEQFGEIMTFLSCPYQHGTITMDNISTKSIGRGAAQLGPETTCQLTAFMAETLNKFGYQ